MKLCGRFREARGFLWRFCLGSPSAGSFLVLRNFSFLKIIGRKKKKRPRSVRGNGSVEGVRVIVMFEKENLSTRIQSLDILHGAIHLIQSDLSETGKIMKGEAAAGE